MADDLTEIILDDAAAWRAWLSEHHASQPGAWLVLAKKGTTEPTSLNYDQALEEALCHGWIDGQARRRDEATYRQRFTPRRKKSSWSKRNVGIVTHLMSEGRMHPAGLAEVERAKSDGRWDAAYARSGLKRVIDALHSFDAGDSSFSQERWRLEKVLKRIDDKAAELCRTRREVLHVLCRLQCREVPIHEHWPPGSCVTSFRT